MPAGLLLDPLPHAPPQMLEILARQPGPGRGGPCGRAAGGLSPPSDICRRGGRRKAGSRGQLAGGRSESLPTNGRIDVVAAAAAAVAAAVVAAAPAAVRRRCCRRRCEPNSERGPPLERIRLAPDARTERLPLARRSDAASGTTPLASGRRGGLVIRASHARATTGVVVIRIKWSTAPCERGVPLLDAGAAGWIVVFRDSSGPKHGLLAIVSAALSLSQLVRQPLVSSTASCTLLSRFGRAVFHAAP